MVNGLKLVRNRRNDALSRVGWEEFEHLLADYYRRQGYAVEHVGTGATGHKFDGGVDLKLRKDDEFIIVQCKRCNAYKVPHNFVHELLGVMVNQGATGAILVNTGKFTRAAIEAATKQGHVQLIDGDDLRAMLGPLPELAEEPDPDARWRRGAEEQGVSVAKATPAKALLDHATERLIVAAEDRIRGGGSGRRKRSTVASLGIAAAGKWLLSTALLLFIVFLAFHFIKATIQQIPIQQQARIQAAAKAAQAQPATATAQPVSTQTAWPPSAAFDAHAYGRRDTDPCHELIDWQSGTYIDHCKHDTSRPTAAEIRESKHKADEAIKVIEADTPDM